MRFRVAVIIVFIFCAAIALAVAVKGVAESGAKSKRAVLSAFPADEEITEPIGEGREDEEAYAGALHERQVGMRKHIPNVPEEVEEDIGGKLGHDIAASIYGEYEPDETEPAAKTKSVEDPE